MDVTEQVPEPTTPLVIEHEETRTLDQGEVSHDGPSELEQHKQDRGYTKPAKTEPEPPPVPEAATPETPQEPKPEKKHERWTDPDTQDVYDMRHKVARRVKALLEDRGKARADVDTLRKERDELMRALMNREPPKAPDTAAQPQGDPEPDPADTAKYPEGQVDRGFIRDMGRWAARQETAERFKQAEGDAQQRQQQQADIAAVTRWQQALPETRKRYADFDTVLERIPNTPENAPIVQLMLGSPVGNDVVYVLGTQPEAMQAYRLATTAQDRMRLLYHIEAQLIQHQRAAAATKPPQTTTAPPPTSPVQAGPGPTVVDWTKSDDPDQYARWKAQRSARR